MINNEITNLNTVTKSSENVVENILNILSDNETYSLTTEHYADASLDVVLNFDDNSMNKNSKLSIPIVETPEKILPSTQSIVFTSETKSSLIDSLLDVGSTTEDSVCATCNSGTNSLLNNVGDNSMNKNSKLSVPIVETPEKILPSTQSIVFTSETKSSLIDSLLDVGITTEDSVCATCNSGTNSLLNNVGDNSMNKNSKLSIPIVETPEKILSSTQSIVSTPETKNSLIDSLLDVGGTTEDSVCTTCNSGTNSLLNNVGGLGCNLICEPNYLKTLILLIETTGLDVKVAINNVIGGLLCPPPKCDLNYIEDVLSLTLAIRDFFGIKSAIGTTTGGLTLDPICSITSLKVEFIID